MRKMVRFDDQPRARFDRTWTRATRRSPLFSLYAAAIASVWAGLFASPVAFGGQGGGPKHQNAGIHAHVKAITNQVPSGHPVRVMFWIENPTEETVTLTVPGAEPQIPPPEMGLPLSHVFSGPSMSGVAITTDSGREWGRPLGVRDTKEAPILLLGPHATVGTIIDLREHFPALRSAGSYQMVWRPYGGAVASDPITIHVATRKGVEILTDEGRLTLELFYDDTPNHVANFIDLVKSGFYDGLTFHRAVAGYLLQGGCPNGDGSGMRSDGKRIAAEPSTRSHRRGSFSMALLGDDPDTGSCQFFICLSEQKEWDGKYTVFGQLVGDESFQTLDKLAATPADESGRPRRTLYLRTVRMIELPVTAGVGTQPPK